MVAASAFLILSVLSVALGNPSASQLLENDLNTLNFALTLEQLGYAFYSNFLQVYPSSSFNNYGGIPTYNYLALIRDQEATHINLVSSTIQQFGGTPHGNCNYSFGQITSVDMFMATATILENICTMALDGAAAALYNKSILTAAATLATVEGRHASFLQYVTTINNPTANPAGGRAYPFGNYTEGGNGAAAFDVAFTPAQVVAAVSNLGLIHNCPFSIPDTYIPVVLPIDLTVNPSLNTPAATLNANDILTLNYALTLEHLEATFYNTYNGIFTAADFVSVGLTAFDYSIFTLIGEQEATHVTFLTSVINSMGGSPVPACQYNFKVPTTFNSSYTRQDGVLDYIYYAQIFENLGVSAYDGAINTLTNKALVQGAATIATIEARHAAYLNYLNSTGSLSSRVNFTGSPFYAEGNPFPAAADTPIVPSDVITAVLGAGFVTSCPVNPTAPAVYFLTPTNTTGTSTSSSSSTSVSTSSTASSSSTTTASVSSTSTSSTVTTSGARTLQAGAILMLAIAFIVSC